MCPYSYINAYTVSLDQNKVILIIIEINQLFLLFQEWHCDKLRDNPIPEWKKDAKTNYEENTTRYLDEMMF